MGDIELTITVDEEVVKGFSDFYKDSASGRCRHIAAAIAAALPKPRPAEPMGLGAVVRDGRGVVWLQTTDEYCAWRNARMEWRDYADLPDPIEVLSEGVIL